MCSARASREMGSTATLAWVMLCGTLALAPWLALTPLPHLDATAVALLVAGGAGNVGGLFLVFRGLRTGQVGVVSPIVSAEGAVAAMIAMVAAPSLDAGKGAALVVTVLGIALVARTGGLPSAAAASTTRAAAWAGAAAVVFGTGLYATGRVTESVPIVWAAAPPRLVGVLVITLPLLIRGGMALNRGAIRFALMAGILEAVGFVSYASGARHSIPVAAVAASLTGAVAAALGWRLFHERLRGSQLIGVGITAIGVAVLSALAG